MNSIEVLAAKLAEDVLILSDELGDDRFYTQVSAVLAASSQSLEEAFLTEIRVRLSEKAARDFLNKKIAESRQAKSDPA
jgi:hypothetical protein